MDKVVESVQTSVQAVAESVETAAKVAIYPWGLPQSVDPCRQDPPADKSLRVVGLATGETLMIATQLESQPWFLEKQGCLVRLIVVNVQLGIAYIDY